MIEIDGSTHSGSGTVLRYAVALASLTREPIHVVRVRTKRPKPGLRAQHVSAVNACCSLSGGRVEGAGVGSQEIVYWPGNIFIGGNFHFDIGTAGSATLAAFTLIPRALFGPKPSTISIIGGLFQDFAPSFFHMKEVLLPVLRSMGADIKVRMTRPGYVPQGRGRMTVEVNPVTSPLEPLTLLDRGSLRKIRGIALASHLSRQQVARRMAEHCRDLFQPTGLIPEIEIVEDDSAAQKGAALALWAHTDTGCLLGADQAGRPGRRSEAIAEFVVRTLLEDLNSEATTDRHLADQLILFAALAAGTTRYKLPCVTEHVRSNLWLVNKILGVKGHIQGTVVEVHGIRYSG